MIHVTDSPILNITVQVKPANEAVTTGESVSVLIVAQLFNVTDGLAVSTGESASIVLLPLPQQTEALHIGESISLSIMGSLQINALDQAFIGEVPALAIYPVPSVSDLITTGDSVSIGIAGPPNVTDKVTTGEVVTLLIPILVPNLSDTVTTGESATLSLLSTIPGIVHDQVFVGESVVLLIPAYPFSVTDGFTTNDPLTLNAFLGGVVVTENATTGEIVSLALVPPTPGGNAVIVATGISLGPQMIATFELNPQLLGNP